MNDLPNKSQASLWSKPAFATGGLLLGITIGSRNPLSFLAGAAAAWSIQAFMLERRKQHVDNALKALDEDGVETDVAPTTLFLSKAPSNLEERDPGIPFSWETPRVVAPPDLIEAAASGASQKESFEPCDISSSADPVPAANAVSYLASVTGEPEHAVQNWSKSWDEQVWSEGQEFPALNETAEPAFSVESPNTTPALSTSGVEFDFVQNQANQDFPQVSPATLSEEETVHTNSSDNIKEILSPLPGVVVPHLPGNAAEETPFMFLEEGAAPIECEPEHLETSAFLEQPVAPFGDSASDFMRALQTPKMEEDFSDSYSPWVEPATPLNSMTSLHTDEWDSFLAATSRSTSTAQFNESADAAMQNHTSDSPAGDLSLSPSHSIIDIPGEEVHNPFGTLAGEPEQIKTVARPRSVLADLVAPKHTHLPEKHSWVNSASLAETMPSSRRPVTLRRLVPLAPAN